MSHVVNDRYADYLLEIRVSEFIILAGREPTDDELEEICIKVLNEIKEGAN